MNFLKGPKNGHFPKGLVNGFCQKIESDIVCVFYGNYKRSFFDILDRKQGL